MKMLASIKSFSHFKAILNYVDGVVFSNKKFSPVNTNSFEVEEMKEIIEFANLNNKEAIIDVTCMLTNNLMDELNSFIMNFKDLNVSYIYSDIGVYTLLKKLGIENRGIYDPKTLITNSYDLNLYLEDNMKACSLSLEIPLKDIKEINSKKKGAVWYKAFGYHQMFYSKRHLISTYSKFLNKDININNDNSYLKEETRGETYPIVENEHGTLLYRSYVVSTLSELEILKSLDYIFLDSVLMEENVFNESVEIYYNTLNGNMSLDSALIRLNELHHIEDGFMYEDTVYIKPEVQR